MKYFICGHKGTFLQEVSPSVFTEDPGKAMRFEAVTDAHKILQEHELDLSIYRVEYSIFWTPNAFDDEI